MERPVYVWLAVALEVFTGVLAIPVGILFINDQPDNPSRFPQGWIERTVFGSYLIPGLYLLVVNEADMWSRRFPLSCATGRRPGLPARWDRA